MKPVLLFAALTLAVLGLVSSTVFLALALLGVRKLLADRTRQRSRRVPFYPDVSLLKPVHGMEPQLERNLESFFDQDYPGNLEILFCARTEDDPALLLARRVAPRYPRVKAQFLVAGEPPYTNAKVWSMQLMEAAASYDLLIISDSDVEVGRDYLTSVVAPFADPDVGCVTCLYRGKPTGGLWSRLEGLGMSVEMTSGVAIANMLEGMKFALGPTMGVRRTALQDIGGFRVFADYCSDDFLLGNWIAARGSKVVLSDYVIDHVIQNRSFLESVRHHIRWMKSTRFSRPKGHLGTGLTFAMPYGILAAIAAAAWHHAGLGIALFCWAYISRVSQSALVGWLGVRDPRAISSAWLYPLRDLMGFFFWAASYADSHIFWRGERYRLEAEGKMVLARDAVNIRRLETEDQPE